MEKFYPEARAFVYRLWRHTSVSASPCPEVVWVHLPRDSSELTLVANGRCAQGCFYQTCTDGIAPEHRRWRVLLSSRSQAMANVCDRLSTLHQSHAQSLLTGMVLDLKLTCGVEVSQNLGFRCQFFHFCKMPILALQTNPTRFPYE